MPVAMPRKAAAPSGTAASQAVVRRHGKPARRETPSGVTRDLELVLNVMIQNRQHPEVGGEKGGVTGGLTGGAQGLSNNKKNTGLKVEHSSTLITGMDTTDGLEEHVAASPFGLKGPGSNGHGGTLPLGTGSQPSTGPFRPQSLANFPFIDGDETGGEAWEDALDGPVTGHSHAKLTTGNDTVGAQQPRPSGVLTGSLHGAPRGAEGKALSEGTGVATKGRGKKKNSKFERAMRRMRNSLGCAGKSSRGDDDEDDGPVMLAPWPTTPDASHGQPPQLSTNSVTAVNTPTASSSHMGTASGLHAVEGAGQDWDLLDGGQKDENDTDLAHDGDGDEGGAAFKPDLKHQTSLKFENKSAAEKSEVIGCVATRLGDIGDKYDRRYGGTIPRMYGQIVQLVEHHGAAPVADAALYARFEGIVRDAVASETLAQQTAVVLTLAAGTAWAVSGMAGAPDLVVGGLGAAAERLVRSLTLQFIKRNLAKPLAEAGGVETLLDSVNNSSTVD